MKMLMAYVLATAVVLCVLTPELGQCQCSFPITPSLVKNLGCTQLQNVQGEYRGHTFPIAASRNRVRLTRMVLERFQVNSEQCRIVDKYSGVFSGQFRRAMFAVSGKYQYGRWRGARFSASAYIAMDVDIRMHSDPSRRTCPTFSTLSCGVTQLSGFKLTKAHARHRVETLIQNEIKKQACALARMMIQDLPNKLRGVLG